MKNYKYNPESNTVEINGIDEVIRVEVGDILRPAHVKLDADICVELRPYDYTWTDKPEIVASITEREIAMLIKSGVVETVNKLTENGFAPKLDRPVKITGDIDTDNLTDKEKIVIKRMKRNDGQFHYFLFMKGKVQVYIEYTCEKGNMSAVFTVGHVLFNPKEALRIEKLDYSVSNTITF